MSILMNGGVIPSNLKRTGVIDVTGQTQLTVMLKFMTDDRVNGTHYLLATYDSATEFSYQISIAVSAIRNILMRTRTDGVGGGVHSITVPYVDNVEQSVFLSIDLTTQELIGYVNGVASAPVSTGTSFRSNDNFDFKLRSPNVVGDDVESKEAAYWIGHAISQADVTAYQSGTDLTALSVPPTEIYRLNGVETDPVVTVVAENDTGNNLSRIAGEVGQPVFGAPSVTPAPGVPVGYTRYTTDIATANVVSAFSFFFGIAVEDGMTVDWVDSVEVLLDSGLATGFILSDPITTTAYFWYPGTGDYIGVEFTYNGVSFTGITFSGLTLGIGIGPSFGYSVGGSVTAISAFTDEFTEGFT